MSDILKKLEKCTQHRIKTVMVGSGQDVEHVQETQLECLSDIPSARFPDRFLVSDVVVKKDGRTRAKSLAETRQAEWIRPQDGTRPICMRRRSLDWGKKDKSFAIASSTASNYPVDAVQQNAELLSTTTKIEPSERVRSLSAAGQDKESRRRLYHILFDNVLSLQWDRLLPHTGTLAAHHNQRDLISASLQFACVVSILCGGDVRTRPCNFDQRSKYQHGTAPDTGTIEDVSPDTVLRPKQKATPAAAIMDAALSERDRGNLQAVLTSAGVSNVLELFSQAGVTVDDLTTWTMKGPIGMSGVHWDTATRILVAARKFHDHEGSSAANVARCLEGMGRAFCIGTCAWRSTPRSQNRASICIVVVLLIR